MRLSVVFLFLLAMNVCFSQGDSIRSRIYSDFLKESISRSDSIKDQDTRLVLVKGLSNFSPPIDFEYLSDYLINNIEDNPYYTSLQKDPVKYFDFFVPFASGFGKLITEDKEIAQLILDLHSSAEQKHIRIPKLLVPYKIKRIRSTRPYYRMSWERFHEKLRDCYGIISFSDVIISPSGDRVVFYVDRFNGQLDGHSALIIMRSNGSLWITEAAITLSIS